MIAAFDVGYLEDGGALAAAVIFEHFTDERPLRGYRRRIAQVAPYVPGLFYRRELPCILELLAGIEEPLDLVIVDGYVSLGDRPGLGQRLGLAIDQDITVIGVAKTFFAGSKPVEVRRGTSRRPLFVTSHGISLKKAKEAVESMHGNHRLPTLLKEVDRLTKEKPPPPLT